MRSAFVNEEELLYVALHVCNWASSYPRCQMYSKPDFPLQMCSFYFLENSGSYLQVILPSWKLYFSYLLFRCYWRWEIMCVCVCVVLWMCVCACVHMWVCMHVCANASMFLCRHMDFLWHSRMSRDVLKVAGYVTSTDGSENKGHGESPLGSVNSDIFSFSHLHLLLDECSVGGWRILDWAMGMASGMNTQLPGT